MTSAETQLYTKENLNLREFPTDPLLEPVARVILENSLQIKKGDRLLILMHPSAGLLAEEVRKQAKAKGAQVIIRYHSAELGEIILEDPTPSLPARASRFKATPEHKAAFITYASESDQFEDALWATKILTIRNKIFSTNDYVVHKDDQKLYDKMQKINLKLRNQGKGNRYVLIYEPDKKEAELAGMSLDEYRRKYYEAINRPWDEVRKAQQILIDFLAKKKTVKIEAPAPSGFPDNWKTEVSMSVEGMRAWNSTIDTNLPGSEFFTAPVAGTLNGTFAVQYPIMFGEQKIIPNIKFVFQNGAIVDVDVYYENPDDPRRKADLEFIEKTTSVEGGKIIGEVGFGTNPLIDRAYLNTLLCEKVGGSIHFAVGDSYVNKGDAITDNGNRSQIHIDITKVLLPEYGGGTISADGEIFQQNGRFLIPGTEILNKQAT